MIDRKKLELEEITWEEYSHFARRSGSEQSDSYPPYTCPVRIITPLVYHSFEDLLTDFLDTPGARRISVQKRVSSCSKRWVKVLHDEIKSNPYGVRYWAAEAESVHHLYIHFQTPTIQQDHEIEFEKEGDNIISRRIVFPFSQRHHYSLQLKKMIGGHEPSHYMQVSCIWVPGSIVLEKSVTPASAVPQSYPASGPHQGQSPGQ